MIASKILSTLNGVTRLKCDSTVKWLMIFKSTPREVSHATMHASKFAKLCDNKVVLKPFVERHVSKNRKELPVS